MDPSSMIHHYEAPLAMQSQKPIGLLVQNEFYAAMPTFCSCLSAGRVMKKLKDLDIDNNTLVILTSDNGPWLMYNTQAGSMGPFIGFTLLFSLFIAKGLPRKIRLGKISLY